MAATRQAQQQCQRHLLLLRPPSRQQNTLLLMGIEQAWRLAMLLISGRSRLLLLRQTKQRNLLYMLNLWALLLAKRQSLPAV